MRYAVQLTDPAAADLEAIVDYLAEHESAFAAARVLDRMEKVIATLAQFPERGVHPQELAALGNHEFRQLLQGPWRVIYRVQARKVDVVLIADGRRDMRTLLTQRLLHACGAD